MPYWMILLLVYDLKSLCLLSRYPAPHSSGESFPNDIPVSRLAGEIKVQQDHNEISEALAFESVNNEDKVKPDMENVKGITNLPLNSNTKEIFDNNNSNFYENPKNEFVHASASSMGQEESFIESATSIAVAEFETKKHIWSDTSGKSEKELVSYDVEDILSEEQVEDGIHLGSV